MDSVTICNLALNMLGITGITSFDEKNNIAGLCKQLFAPLRDRVLRDHSWSFADKACDLARVQNVESIDPDKPCVCSVPGDCIAMRYCLYNIPFRPWGRYIMVPALPAKLIYTARIEDATLFDDTFVAALQYMIAAELAMNHTRDLAMVNMYRQEYNRQLAIARSIDSQENVYSYQNARRNSRWISNAYCDDHASGITAACGQSINWVEGTEGKQVN